MVMIVLKCVVIIQKIVFFFDIAFDTLTHGEIDDKNEEKRIWLIAVCELDTNDEPRTCTNNIFL